MKRSRKETKDPVFYGFFMSILPASDTHFKLHKNFKIYYIS